MLKNTTTDDSIAIISRFKLTDAKFVVFGIIGVIAVFTVLILFVGGGRSQTHSDYLQ
jgi:hypothetical protein